MQGKGGCCWLPALFLAVFIKGQCFALDIDTEFRVNSWQWSGADNSAWPLPQSTAVWNEVVHRVGSMAQVTPAHDKYAATRIWPPASLACGPRFNEPIAPRHINTEDGSLVMPSQSSLLVYLYTDTTTLTCMTGGTVAYAYV